MTSDQDRAAETASDACQTDLERALADAERANAMLDRQLFRLRTLYEVTSELAGLADSEAICETFLLLVMGPLGLVSGFVLRTNQDARPGEGDDANMTVRGLEEDESQRLRDGATALLSKLFPPAAGHPERPVLLSGAHLGRGSELPRSIRTLAAAPLGQHDHLLVGFGPNLAGEEPGPDELDLISSLIVNLRVALSTARAAETVARLNADLARKNESLNATLQRVLAAQAELDRRAFQLRSLYEVASDLSGLTLPADVAETFLLDLLGVVSASEGYVLVCEADPGATLAAVRGVGEEAAASLGAPKARGDVLAAHVALKDRLPHAMQAVLVTEPEPLSLLPGPAEAALFFAVDRDCRGVAGLGPRLAGGPYGDDGPFLGSLATSFLSSLARARQFATITRLNRELTERNAELTRTIAELTSARREIDLLTAAKERILGLVRGELRRAGKVGWLDFVLILVFGTALGLLYNLASPSGIPLMPPALFAPAPAAITPREAAPLLAEGGAVIIDARPAEFHEAGRIPGAINMPSAIFDFVYGMHLAARDPELPVIVYGRTVSSRYDLEAAQKLERLGHTDVRVLDGGLDAWLETGLPMEARP